MFIIIAHRISEGLDGSFIRGEEFSDKVRHKGWLHKFCSYASLAETTHLVSRRLVKVFGNSQSSKNHKMNVGIPLRSYTLFVFY